ncbi:aminoglycoside N(3)-acetyltransferase [Streptomyces sp. NPDC058632]|uniref:aminoglycoside N(3)-acetyltransferase n=1 Tax=Streptomyces sp. NPDC058632 TaxID=3346567 RepID=UPI0036658A00
MPAPLPTGPLVTRDPLAAGLADLGVRRGETLLVHSSLSSLGRVNGGPVAAVGALLDVLGPDGTLVVPAQSGDLCDPAPWSDPPVPETWWETMRATMPGYDPATAPTRGAGVVPETVRTRPGALRSAHPQTSFAALGRRAAEVVAVHAQDCRPGEHSPPAALERLDARVLLPGTGYDTCACLHLAEYRIPPPLVAVGRPGPAGRETLPEVPITSGRFDEPGHDFERDRPAGRPVLRGTVGAAGVRLFPLPDAVAYTRRWLELHRPRTEEFRTRRSEACGPYLDS